MIIAVITTLVVVGYNAYGFIAQKLREARRAKILAGAAHQRYLLAQQKALASSYISRRPVQSEQDPFDAKFLLIEAGMLTEEGDQLLRDSAAI